MEIYVNNHYQIIIQPVAVSINANCYGFGFYAGGIYICKLYSIYKQSCPGIYAPENCGNGEDDLDHAVLVVGSVILSDTLKL